MAELKHPPVAHDHSTFLARAHARRGFIEAYESLAPEYEVISQLLKSRTQAGPTQDTVAERLRTTKSAVSRLEGSGEHASSLATLRKYALAVGCELQVRLGRQSDAERHLRHKYSSAHSV